MIDLPEEGQEICALVRRANLCPFLRKCFLIEKEMSFIYVINGVVGLVRQWIAEDFRMSVDRISRLVIDMSFRSVGLNPSDAYKVKIS